jgi:hypothetical protein
MKKYYFLIIVALILGLILTGCSLLSNVGQVPANEQSGVSSVVKSFADKNYGDITLTGGSQSGHFPEVWDLTGSDMTISFTYDANGLVDDAGAHAWAALGIREVGYPDFNPTWLVEGAGVWLATDYEWTVDTFDPDPVGFPSLDMDDKLILQKAGGHGEGDYNLPHVPVNPNANHRVWWDRDGVDPWQNTETANTGGIYDIEITLTATSATTGEAYMKINGLYQGFEEGGGWGTIECTPAGMTFTGDMTKMQVFYGLYGYGTTHSVSFNDIRVDGFLRTIVINGCDTGVVDVLYDYDDNIRISEVIEKIYFEAKNHGQFVRGVALLTNELVKAGIITGEEKGKIQSCAAQANQLPREYGLVLWLDAGEGVTAASGVERWEDQSGSGNHALQNIESFQPTYIPGGLNGEPVVSFTGGTEQYLRHPSILSGDYTAFYVLKLYESKLKSLYYYHAGAVSSGHLGFFAEYSIAGFGWGSISNHPAINDLRTSNEYPTELDWRIHTHQPSALYKNGNVVSCVNVDDVNVDVDGLTDIGSRSDNGSLYFVGDIAEILVYDRILSDSEREFVETYLNAKYDIY